MYKVNVAVVGSSGYIASAIIRRMEQEDSIGSVIKIGRTGDADAYLDLTDAFLKNSPQITQMKSLYIETYNIIEKGIFTAKIQKELRGLKL